MPDRSPSPRFGDAAPEASTAPGRARDDDATEVAGARAAQPELRSSELELADGALVDHYMIEARRGGGGFASVYRARDTRTGATVAVKLLHAYLVRTPSVLRRFQLEADTIARLDHPNIVRLLGCGELRGVPYLVMEWLDGDTLAELLRARGPLALAEALPVLAEVAGALAAAHARGVIHRDLKASNIALAPGGARLLDFGVAKLLDGDGGPAGLTTAGSKLGTPHYMAPEQILARPVDHRADIYAFGILAFELVTGRRPFDGANLVEIEERQLVEPPPAASQLAAVPAAFDAVIRRAMDKDPARRHGSIGELLDELRACAGGGAAAPRAGAIDRRPAVAIYAHAELRGDDAGDDVLDLVDRAIARVREAAGALGLAVVAELGGSALLVVGTPPAAERAGRLAQIASALRAIAERHHHAELLLAFTIHAADVEVEVDAGGGRFVGGPLLELAGWTCTDRPGVHVTAAARRAS